MNPSDPEKAPDFGIRLGKNLEAACQVYRTCIMYETVAEAHQTPLMGRLGEEYQQGKTDIPKVQGQTTALPAYAYDFFVPSVYQVLAVDVRLLGQYIRLDASHNSGKSKAFEAGREIAKVLMKLFESLRAGISPLHPSPGEPAAAKHPPCARPLKKFPNKGGCHRYKNRYKAFQSVVYPRKFLYTGAKTVSTS